MYDAITDPDEVGQIIRDLEWMIRKEKNLHILAYLEKKRKAASMRYNALVPL